MENQDEKKAGYEKEYEKPDAIWTHEEPPAELAELVKSGKAGSGRALDLGCGEGFYSIYLAKNGFEVTGVDFTARALEYARKNAKAAGIDANNIKFIHADVLTEMDRIKGPFDFVLEWALMHSIPHQQRASYVKDVASRLKPGGKYLSVCFNDQSPEWGGPGRKVRESPIGGKLYFSSQDELRELFSPHFRVITSGLIKIGSKEAEPHLSNFFFMEKK